MELSLTLNLLILISGITSGLIFNYDEKIDNEFIRYESQYFNTVVNNFAEIGRAYGRSNDRVFFYMEVFQHLYI